MERMKLMKTRLYWLVVLPVLMLGFIALGGSARSFKGDAKEDTAKEVIAKNGEAFIEAFHKGDAAALAAFWTEDADHTNAAGTHLKGREAIQKSFETFFAENKGHKLRINSASLRFLTPDVAVEDGTSEVIPPDGGPPSRTHYTVVHVQKDGKWLLGSLREATFLPSTNYEHLHDLEWTVGDWADEEGKGRSGFDPGPSTTMAASAKVPGPRMATSGSSRQPPCSKTGKRRRRRTPSLRSTRIPRVGNPRIELWMENHCPISRKSS
jgi:uncharacterized protein (TIGR02246 family)